MRTRLGRCHEIEMDKIFDRDPTDWIDFYLTVQAPLSTAVYGAVESQLEEEMWQALQERLGEAFDVASQPLYEVAFGAVRKNGPLSD